MTNKPVAKWGKEIRVSAWEMKNKKSVSFSIEKAYKDKVSDTWKKTPVWFWKDLEKLIPFLTEAIEYAKKLEEEEKAWTRPAKEDW